MKLVLKRFVFGDNYTISNLFVNGVVFCQVLEDKVREIAGVQVAQWKIQDGTAIPKGTYKVIIDHSEHFGKDMFHILDIPGFGGVRIHGGNTDKDTEGCLIVGRYTMGKGDWIDNSQPTLTSLYGVVKPVLDRGEEVTITVE